MFQESEYPPKEYLRAYACGIAEIAGGPRGGWLGRLPQRVGRSGGCCLRWMGVSVTILGGALAAAFQCIAAEPYSENVSAVVLIGYMSGTRGELEV